MELKKSTTVAMNTQCALTADTVTLEQCADQTVSIVGSVGTISGGFTRVPHQLLRGEAKFAEPIDFMVCLHLLTFSHGFGRREAHMSQAQLERFTGAAKNTIKRSLERLVAQGWIRCIEEYDRARTSRRWRVLTPEDRPDLRRLPNTRTVSSPDTLQVELCPPRTGSLSKLDPLTVSKIAPYKERDPKEKSKNSLSAQVPVLQNYFASVKPSGKRESEWKAFLGLRRDYREDQIAACLERLIAKGIPGTGAPCHSPMGFLSKAMGQVWGEVQIDQEKRAKAEVRAKGEAEERALQRADEAAEEQAARLREEAFRRAFPTPKQEALALDQYGGRFPAIARSGPLLRNLAIAAWWDERAERAP